MKLADEVQPGTPEFTVAELLDRWAESLAVVRTEKEVRERLRLVISEARKTK